MFATSFPEHPESARVLTKADEELFALNEFDRVIEVSHADPRAQSAGRARLSAHRDDAAGALAVRSRALTPKPRPPTCARRDTSPPTTRIAPAIEERIAASIYKQAEAKRAAGDATGAVDDFLRVGALAPNAKVRANAEFDAASILVQNKQWDRAAQVLEKLPSQVSESRAGARSDAQARGRVPGNGPRHAGGRANSSASPRAPRRRADVRRAALWQAAELYEKSGIADQRRAHCTRAM